MAFNFISVFVRKELYNYFTSLNLSIEIICNYPLHIVRTQCHIVIIQMTYIWDRSVWYRQHIDKIWIWSTILSMYILCRSLYIGRNLVIEAHWRIILFSLTPVVSVCVCVWEWERNRGFLVLYPLYEEGWEGNRL